MFPFSFYYIPEVTIKSPQIAPIKAFLQGSGLDLP